MGTLRLGAEMTCQGQMATRASTFRLLYGSLHPSRHSVPLLVLQMSPPTPAIAIQRLRVHRLSDWDGDHLSNWTPLVLGHYLALPGVGGGFADLHSASQELNGQITHFARVLALSCITFASQWGGGRPLLGGLFCV